MCGRLFFEHSASVEMLIRALGFNDYQMPSLPNMAPTEAVPVVHFLEGQLTISPMRWWLVPSWSDGPSTKFAMFNARIESVQTSRAYKGPLKYRRGIVPASAFMEWQAVAGKKQPYYFTGDPTPLALAAIWEEWGGELLSVSVLTQPADSNFTRYHARMPVMLSGEQINHWLDHRLAPKDVLAAVSGASVPLLARTVDPQLNNARLKVFPDSFTP